ncbi:hypothetical protein CEE35_04400, partial [Candidatus Aerophobetes bacterium Ae_b3b]
KCLTEEIVSLATRYVRYGQEQNNSTTRDKEGWIVNHKRVERIWRKKGLRVSQRQPKRSRLMARMMAHVLDLRSRMQGPCVELRPYGSKNGGWKSI